MLGVATSLLAAALALPGAGAATSLGVRARVATTAALWATAAEAASATDGDEPREPRPGVVVRGEEVEIVAAAPGAVGVAAGWRRGWVRRSFLWPGPVRAATALTTTPLLDRPAVGAAEVGRAGAGAVLLVLGAEGGYRRVSDRGHRSAWARAADLCEEPAEVYGALLLERARWQSARGRAAEAAEAWASAWRAGVRADVVADLARAAGLRAPASPAVGAAGAAGASALRWYAAAAVAPGGRQWQPGDAGPLELRAELRAGAGPATARVDWRRLAREHLAAFPVDAPVPAVLLRASIGASPDPSADFDFAAPLPPDLAGASWYALGPGGVARASALRLAGTVRVYTDAAGRELDRAYHGTLALQAETPPAQRGRVVVLRMPAPVRVAAAAILGPPPSVPDAGAVLGLTAEEGDAARAFVARAAARGRRPLAAYAFELAPGDRRYLYVAYPRSRDFCASRDVVYDIAAGVREVLSIEYDCDT